MDTLTTDLWNYIVRFIRCNKDKCQLLMTNSQFSTFEIYFNEPVLIQKIRRLDQFDLFTDIIVSSGNFTDSFPKFIDHLIFDKTVNEPVIIPLNTIKSVTFGESFNKPVKDCIPSSVINLIFGYGFNQSIENSIPSTVVYLEFGRWFNKSVDGNIPSSVIHLTLGCNFNQPIDGIPYSVKYLTLCGCFSEIVMKTIPSTVKYLILRGLSNDFLSDTPLDDYISDRTLKHLESCIINGKQFLK